MRGDRLVKEIHFIRSKACEHPLKMLHFFHSTLRITAVGKQKFESPVELDFRKWNGIKTVGKQRAEMKAQIIASNKDSAF